ncbi:MAG: hypothetical protein DRQ59_14330 [Gammaproteobacteria bacterium]|nr:MAG: hypothetical protein DRQ59_14330 [Gammaproteobacteria bacterium]
MTRLRFVLMCAVLLVAVAGCGKGEGESQSSAQNHGQRQPGSGQRPGGAAGAAKAIPVAVQPAALGSIASYYKATATLEAEKQAEVLARVTGVVTSLAAEEGDFVAAGAPLLTIGNDEYRLRLQQAAARTANLQSRFDRLQAMKAEELSTEEEFEAARSDLASAEADEGLARLNLSYTTVRAPFAGRITARLVDLGQTVSANTALFVMADFDPLLARVHVPSREFRKLRQDQLVDLVLDSSGARMQGRITLISPIIDPNSGTIKITVEVSAYPDDTRPGDFAEVQIVTERRDDVVLVQRSAVITDKGETVVYVAVTDGDTDQAERRLVTVGFSDDSNTQIVSGLAVGESVVVKGQRSLKHGAAMKILAETTDVAADGVAD